MVGNRKKEETDSKSDKYQELYEQLDTREGVVKIYIIAKGRKRKAKVMENKSNGGGKGKNSI